MSTASGWSIWRRSATRAWCRARLRPCSAWKSAPKIHFPAWSPPSGTIGCCCCSTIASTSLTRRLAWRRRFSAARRASTSWRPAGSRSGSRVNAMHRLGPLSSPEPSSGLTAAEAAAFPAVQLFVERVTAIVEDFALTDANAPLVVEICRQARRLAAGDRVRRAARRGAWGRGPCRPPGRQLPLLTARRRTAMPRHRTMRAVVDWSYGLLSEDEQRFFRALGIFAGGFTVEAPQPWPWMQQRTRIDAIDRLADLVAKSLVVADVSGAKPRFRLLDTTRASSNRDRRRLRADRCQCPAGRRDLPAGSTACRWRSSSPRHVSRRSG